MQALPPASRLLHKGVATTGVGRDALQRVAVHQLAPVHRMSQAADLVFELTQGLPRPGVDDRLKTILMLVTLLRDQVPALEKRMGAGKIGDVNGDMMTVVGREV